MCSRAILSYRKIENRFSSWFNSRFSSSLEIRRQSARTFAIVDRATHTQSSHKQIAHRFGPDGDTTAATAAHNKNRVAAECTRHDIECPLVENENETQRKVNAKRIAKEMKFTPNERVDRRRRFSGIHLILCSFYGKNMKTTAQIELKSAKCRLGTEKMEKSKRQLARIPRRHTHTETLQAVCTK